MPGAANYEEPSSAGLSPETKGLCNQRRRAAAAAVSVKPKEFPSVYGLV
jgi:hypothetical protein